MIKQSFSKSDWLATGVFVLLCLASFAVKTLNLADPYFGAHIFRQLQTMSTIDAYVAHGVDLFHPKVNWNGYPGYIITEFPIFQALCAYISHITHYPLQTTRIVNLVFGAVTALPVFLVAVFWFNRRVALYSTLFFLFSPLNIMFHQSTLIDISSVCLVMLAFTIFLYRWESKSVGGVILFCLASSLAVLIKPLYFLPVILLFGMRAYEDFASRSFHNIMKTVSNFKHILISLGVATVILSSWMIMSPSGSSMLNYMVWEMLLTPQFYVNIFVRFGTQFLNPFTVMLFLIGLVMLWKTQHNERRLLWILPIGYYLIFPHLNFPHVYYSLILIPFLSIIAGYGAVWLEESLLKQGVLKNVFFFRIAIWCFAAFFSVVSFANNLTASQILPSQRYEKISQEVTPHLEPMQYAAVYINRNAEFSEAENLRNRPSVYLKSFFKELPRQELLGREKDHPLVRTAVMYALRQYGEMEFTDSPQNVHVPDLQIRYENNLRYVLFYLFDDTREILNVMKPYSPVYQSQDWVIYEVKKD